ncbi:ImmA/IrrE family metallo-endopeptidase [Aneurinibacillus aneurinilyticus]|nr:ImmA/IrrE family metallo-endopeptidase [Aneurinibacillus aneurinilyticus]MED0704882.1 ImmA/IrrE family metallo-endopeptidase [Aneurinibacillus aneurinilyticus]MED0724076.1 ImmA/IrrE family metallo-endopeptidase [Aneurinibacillus aneurinilyticus]MED0731927.1 ImmA/IrrE family metallo-endopeptidase [Aneurinibacillus aneurinilyticus]MED0741543.1 ImmA/IrrE family metallo-endopeptidase [Aneurinibacillus aneurinilyticus]
MLKYYTKTMLEIWIEEQYKQKGILSPRDLTIERVCTEFCIEIEYTEKINNVVWDEELIIVYLNQNLSSQEQKEAFFHELCHPLRHVADQRNRHPIFRGLIELQEEQARNFQPYATIPFFMIEQLELPSRDKEIAGLLAQTFNTTYFFAYRRWEQIKRRIFQGIFDEKIKSYLEIREEIFARFKKEYNKFFYY